MSFEIPESGSGDKKKIERVQEGVYPAIPVHVITIGKQVQTDWKTNEPLTYEDGNPIIHNEVWINFELPTETVEIDGKTETRWLGRSYKISSQEKAALAGLMKAAGLKATGSMAHLIGKPVLIQVGSTSGGKAKIVNVSPLMKGMAVPQQTLEPVLFDFNNPDEKVFESLPKFLQDKITSAVNYKGVRSPKWVPEEPEDAEGSPLFDYRDNILF